MEGNMSYFMFELNTFVGWLRGELFVSYLDYRPSAINELTKFIEVILIELFIYEHLHEQFSIIVFCSSL